MRLVIEGLEEAQDWIADVSARVKGGEAWGGFLGKVMEGARRFAVSISPVVTGSYAGSHRTAVSGMDAELYIDPNARNAGTPVTDYAGSVEERHQVYGRTAAGLPGILDKEEMNFLRRVAG